MIYPGINNLELNRKITKFIFRLHYSIFHIHKSPKITLIAFFFKFTPNFYNKTLNGNCEDCVDEQTSEENCLMRAGQNQEEDDACGSKGPNRSTQVCGETQSP